jgi:regulator of sigma E protease
MGVLITIGLMLLALSILIVIHEAGHFWAARMFKIRVEKFYLFFDFLFPLPNVLKFSLFKVKKGETEYGLGWFPLGGYVNISGMIDETTDETALAAAPEPWEFRSKPIWQRLIVMLGGVIMNVILGCLIFIGLKYFVGDTVVPMSNVQYGIYVNDTSLMYQQGFRTGDQILNYRGQVYPNLDDYASPAKLVDTDKSFEVKHVDGKVEKITLSDDFLDKFQDSGERTLFSPDFGTSLDVVTPEDSTKRAKALPDQKPISTAAYHAGLRQGDLITMLDSVPMSRFREVRSYLKEHPLTAVNFQVLRAGKTMDFRVEPTDSFFGIGENSSILADTITYSIGEAIPKGIAAAFGEVVNNVKGLKALFTGKVNASKSMSGPIGIARIYGASFANGGWTAFWRLTGILSMVLAVMNLLPIPVLDGGHVLILCIEGIIGREIPIKTKGVIMNIGMIMVLALMAFVIFNDVFKMIF